MASMPAGAAPDKSDTLAHLLTERGWLAPEGPVMAISPVLSATPALAQKVRAQASSMVQTAMTFLGVPYRRGGTSEDTGFDCSGFTRHVFEQSRSLLLPRRADEQAKADGLVTVKRDDLEPGDLVFFNTLRAKFSHVGIYLGEGKFIHAPRAGSEVRVEDMRFSYWARRFTGARRAEADDAAVTGLAASMASPTVTASPASLATSIVEPAAPLLYIPTP